MMVQWARVIRLCISVAFLNAAVAPLALDAWHIWLLGMAIYAVTPSIVVRKGAA